MISNSASRSISPVNSHFTFDPSTLDPDIRAQLDAENSYYEDATADLEALRERLFEEMRGRIKEDDSSVPATDGEFAYAVRYREGGEYPVFVRTPREGGPETRAAGGKGFHAGSDYGAGVFKRAEDAGNNRRSRVGQDDADEILCDVLHVGGQVERAGVPGGAAAALFSPSAGSRQ